MATPGRIRVFRADTMFSSSFGDDDRPPALLEQAGIAYVDDPRAADVIVGPNEGSLRKFGRIMTRMAICTNEPRFDLHTRSPMRLRGIRQPVHIMNLYIGGVFADNYQLMEKPKGVPDRDEHLRRFAAKPFRAVILATYHRKRNRFRWFLKQRMLGIDTRSALVLEADGSIMRDGTNIDLFHRRQAIALHLRARGFCDIYGRNWPSAAGFKGESRFGGRTASKLAILKDYAINIAYENTIFPHYVTEKIWDAIEGACLPVYHGAGNRIYDDLPEGSFIEAAGKSVEQLADEIMNINRREAADRYEACLDVYLRVLREDRHAASIRRRDEHTAAFVTRVMDEPL